MINLTKLDLNLRYKIYSKNLVSLLQVLKYNENKISDKGGKEIA